MPPCGDGGYMAQVIFECNREMTGNANFLDFAGKLLENKDYATSIFRTVSPRGACPINQASMTSGFAAVRLVRISLRLL